mmetsp:Transcript_32842/g.78465  ORF Transcript_32842/g.78465 Transcript_32842/m.78465 type:complete len:93 (-) Transcript_32842:51-329(-)
MNDTKPRPADAKGGSKKGEEATESGSTSLVTVNRCKQDTKNGKSFLLEGEHELLGVAGVSSEAGIEKVDMVDNCLSALLDVGKRMDELLRRT